MNGQGILEELEIQTVVILVFRIGIEAIHADGTGKIMVHDSAVDDTIPEIFDFHFVAGFWNYLCNPVKDCGLTGHGAGSTGLLHHDRENNEVFGLLYIERNSTVICIN